MTREIAYLDSSALVKLVVREPETAALRRYLRGRSDLASSALARTEVIRAVRHLGAESLRRARALLRRIDLVRLDDLLLDTAAMLDPPPLRSLDAIHLASGLVFAEDLGVFLTYDARMAAAGESLGLNVETPGRKEAR